MRGRGKNALAAGVAALALGCGGTPSATTSHAPTAQELLAAASATLKATPSYHVAGMVEPGLTVDLTMTPDAATGSMTAHDLTWRIVVTPEGSWISGRELWAATLAPDRAAAFGDSWVRVTDPSAAFGYARILPTLPTTIPEIVSAPRPGLTVGGSATVDGRPATELRTATVVYDIAAQGPPYPLRWLDKDLPGPGGEPGGLTLDSFGARVTVTPPSDVVGALTPSPTPVTTATPTGSPAG